MSVLPEKKNAFTRSCSHEPSGFAIAPQATKKAIARTCSHDPSGVSVATGNQLAHVSKQTVTRTCSHDPAASAAPGAMATGGGGGRGGGKKRKVSKTRSSNADVGYGALEQFIAQKSPHRHI